MSTLYQTNCTAEIDINAPKMLVKPQINTVKWSMSRFLLSSADVVLGEAIVHYLGAL